MTSKFKTLKISDKITIALITIFITLFLYGCSKSTIETTNTKKQADNFELVRECTVYNTRSDKPIFHTIANFSLNVDETDQQLELICETEDKEGNTVYKRHLIRYNEDTIHMVNDVSDQDYSKTHYEYQDFRNIPEDMKGEKTNVQPDIRTGTD